MMTAWHFRFAFPNRARLQAAVLGIAKPFKFLLMQVKADHCFCFVCVCVCVCWGCPELSQLPSQQRLD